MTGILKDPRERMGHENVPGHTHQAQQTDQPQGEVPKPGSDIWRVARILQTAHDSCRKPLSELRVLDLGCLTGRFSVEFGLWGAEVLGIEGREQHVRNAQTRAKNLGLEKVRFLQEDVRKLSVQQHGHFDLVLCLGILYHIDQPQVFDFMERIAAVCRDTLIVDTHIAIKGRKTVEYKGQRYHGLDYYEYSHKLSLEQMKRAIWASLDNPTSFWPTRSSLFNILRHSGFTSVAEIVMPYMPSKGNDRMMLLAKKGQIVLPRSTPSFRIEDLLDCPEQEKWNVHPYQYRHRIWGRKMLDMVPLGLKQRLKRMYRRS